MIARIARIFIIIIIIVIIFMFIIIIIMIIIVILLIINIVIIVIITIFFREMELLRKQGRHRAKPYGLVNEHTKSTIKHNVIAPLSPSTMRTIVLLFFLLTRRRFLLSSPHCIY